MECFLIKCVDSRIIRDSTCKPSTLAKCSISVKSFDIMLPPGVVRASPNGSFWCVCVPRLHSNQPSVLCSYQSRRGRHSSSSDESSRSSSSDRRERVGKSGQSSKAESRSSTPDSQVKMVCFISPPDWWTWHTWLGDGADCVYCHTCQTVTMISVTPSLWHSVMCHPFTMTFVICLCLSQTVRSCTQPSYDYGHVE